MISLREISEATQIIIPIELDIDIPLEICEPGENTDKNSLLFMTPLANGEPRAIPSGISPYAVVCSFSDKRSYGQIPVIRTASVRRTLAFAYSKMYDIDYSRVGIIGITGTSGKSTTAQLLHKILSYNNIKAGLIGTGTILIGDDEVSERYYSMTTPDPKYLYKHIKKMIDSGCKYIIMEASSHSIALEKLTPIKFELALFTNLSSEHRDFHKSIEDYLATKLKIFDQAKKAIVNIDDPYIRGALNSIKIERSEIGIIHRGDVFATDIHLRSLHFSSFYYRQKDLIFGVDLKLGGAYNIYNALMAMRAAIELGIKPTMVKQAINYVEGIKGRMECIDAEITVIIDYAHTTEALNNLLKSINNGKKPRQKIITVFGCGGERDKDKRPEMGYLANKLSDMIIITEDNNRNESFDEIANSILAGIENRENVNIIAERETAIRYAILSAADGDIVAIIGKGHEDYIIDSNGYRPFDEREIVRGALEDRRNANRTK